MPYCSQGFAHEVPVSFDPLDVPFHDFAAPSMPPMSRLTVLIRYPKEVILHETRTLTLSCNLILHNTSNFDGKVRDRTRRTFPL